MGGRDQRIEIGLGPEARVDRRSPARFVAGTAWSDSIIWREVAVGIALIPLAVYFWRRAIRDDRRRRT